MSIRRAAISARREAMRETNMKKAISMSKLLPVVMLALALLFTATAHAAAPGITGPSFNLTAQPAYLTQPDGHTFAPPATLMTNATCPSMQVPGPTLIVTEGTTVSVALTNGLPTSAGNTSILFPGFAVTATGGVAGLLTR